MRDFILSRLSEPSTWAGLSGVLISALHLAPTVAGAATGVVAAVAGLVAVVLKEKDKAA